MLDKIIENINIELVYVVRILLSGICGWLIGMERRKRNKEAGIGTHFIVALGSGLLMCVSISFANDPSRIAAQIVSGIGFLGSGIIIFRREYLHGLTTAAGIWATAGIGMALGVGMYVLGFMGTLIIIVAQLIFHADILRKKSRFHLLLVKFIYTDETVSSLKTIFGVKVFTRFKTEIIDSKHMAEAVIRTQNNCCAESLSCIVNKSSNIYFIERLEDI